LVIELFPFIFEASQRMSARAISRFLLEEQGVKLSAVTITKALNDPKKSWNAFFDTIDPSARDRWTPFFGPRNAEIKLGFQVLLGLCFVAA
jgi:hypothetical protein